MELREVTLLAVVVRIFAAVVIGGLIGLERELKNRPAGLRTYMVVCLGSCLVMMTNQYICQVMGTGDPVRMGAQVVSGIGFLGAGTIIVTRRSQIKGLTTAAGLWTTACTGLAIGIGFYEAAIVGGLTAVIVMTVMQYIDRSVQRKSKSLELYIELGSACSLGDFLRALRSQNIEVQDIHREQDMENEKNIRSYIAFLKLKKRQHYLEILEELQKIPGVEYIEKL
ncbi:MAG: MgtC/SapB family protein [Oscillospiraceae bacterium]|nr:MgtC/SapB family protein [Oscillospiraceae bacterium]